MGVCVWGGGVQKHKSLNYLPLNRGIMANHYKIQLLTTNQYSITLSRRPSHISTPSSLKAVYTIKFIFSNQSIGTIAL